MAQKQTRLTKEQIDKFYQEYVTRKSKKFAGDLLDKKIWKNELELLMNTEVETGVNWSNTEIRKANELLIREGGWSRKQTEAFVNNVVKAEGDSELGTIKKEIMRHFNVREQDLERFVRENQGKIYSYLTSMTEDGLIASWNEYFNS